MEKLKTWQHLEHIVDVVVLGVDTQLQVAEIFGKESADGLLATLKIERDELSGCNVFTFRYKTDTVESTLKAGDYLAEMNNATFKAFTAEEFEKMYAPTEDDVVPPVPNSFPVAFLKYVKKHHHNLDIVDLDKMYQRIKAIVEVMDGNLDRTTNIFTFKFENMSLISPKGLYPILQEFEKASYVNADTKFRLSFCNTKIGGKRGEEDTLSDINSFNLAALQELEGEFKRLSAVTRARIIGLDFSGLKRPSAVAQSVSEGAYMDWIDDIRLVTGITRNSAITR